jgi:hypothetical protein
MNWVMSAQFVVEGMGILEEPGVEEVTVELR